MTWKFSSRRLWNSVSSVLLILGLSASLTGCFDATEVENLNVVAGIGVDLLQNNVVRVTMEIFHPTRSGQSGGAEQRKRQSFIVAATGSTIEEAMSHFTKRSPRKMYYAHNAMFIFGRQFAEQGIDRAFDYVERDRNYRRNCLILIADNTASEVLEATLITPQVTAVGIRQIIDELSKESEVYNTEQLTVLRQYLEPSHTSLASVIGLTAEGLPKVAGMALLKQGKLVSVLRGPTLEGMLWTLGETRQIPITIETHKTNPGQQTTIRLIHTYRKIRWHTTGRRLNVEVTVIGRAELEHSAEAETLDPKVIRTIEKETEQYIKTQMKTSLQAMKRSNADGAQLASSLHRLNPMLWKQNANRWDSVFPAIQANYHIHIDIIRTGLIGKPPKGTHSAYGSLPPAE